MNPVVFHARQRRRRDLSSGHDAGGPSQNVRAAGSASDQSTALAWHR